MTKHQVAIALAVVGLFTLLREVFTVEAHIGVFAVGLAMTLSALALLFEDSEGTADPRDRRRTGHLEGR